MANSPFRSNPFATRHVAPGQLPWVTDEADSIDTLALRLRKLHFRAAITGPHGSGKSTLLAHLAPHLGTIRYRQSVEGRVIQENESGILVWLQLRKSTKPNKQIAASRHTWEKDRILILDGFEQLGRLRQLWTICDTWRKRMGLLVTCHQPVPLPTLTKTNMTADKAGRIIAFLLASGESTQRTDANSAHEKLQFLLEKHDGNMREVLMELYDQDEQRLRCGLESFDRDCL